MGLPSEKRCALKMMVPRLREWHIKSGFDCTHIVIIVRKSRGIKWPSSSAIHGLLEFQFRHNPTNGDIWLIVAKIVASPFALEVIHEAEFQQTGIVPNDSQPFSFLIGETITRLLGQVLNSNSLLP
jgi:hypothetical protein